IQPDSGYACGSEPYFLEVNGVRAGRFNTSCSVSVYLPTPGRYSWRTILYIYETATTVTGSVTTFTIASAAVAPPATNTTPADTTAPAVAAVHSTLTVGRTGRLLYRVSDNSGAATVALGVFSGPTEVWSKTLPSVQAPAPSPLYYVPWRPARRGTY